MNDNIYNIMEADRIIREANDLNMMGTQPINQPSFKEKVMYKRRKFVPIPLHYLNSLTLPRIFIKLNHRIFKLYNVDRYSSNKYCISYRTLDWERNISGVGDMVLPKDYIVHVDINNSQLPPRLLTEIYGNDIKFRYYDWSPGRWAVLINDEYIFDSTLGIRRMPSSERAVLHEPLELTLDLPNIETLNKLKEDPASILTCGFELETQSSESYTKCDFQDEDEDGYYEEDGAYEIFTDLYKVEITVDESVDGFEFRTYGGLSVSDFEGAVDSVYQYKHNIDTRCSFHIHIGIPEFKFKYDRAMRQHMLMYILRNKSRLPESVRSRFADSRANYFFLADDGDAKMNFINFHYQGTLEFRCFGNVQNATDAKLCLELAVEALMDYIDNPTTRVVGGDWNDKVREALKEDELDAIINNYNQALNISEDEILTKVNVLRGIFNSTNMVI